MKRSIWIILGWLTLLAVAQAASLYCGKAASKIEKLICSDDKLSKLDEKLDSAYKTALQDKNKAEAIRHAQKKWMEKRNSCPNAACVKLAYEKRISELTSTSDSTSTNSK